MVAHAGAKDPLDSSGLRTSFSIKMALNVQKNFEDPLRCVFSVNLIFLSSITGTFLWQRGI